MARRRTNFPAAMNFVTTEEQRGAVFDMAEQLQWSVGEVLRDVTERGLRSLAESRRKAEARARQQEAQ